MKTMRVAQIPKAGADFEVVEREIPKPGLGHVRIRVQACGVCHSDVLTKEGGWPGLAYPRVPGHEVAGVIDEVGPGVTCGDRGNGSVSAGTAVRTGRASRAGVATS